MKSTFSPSWTALIQFLHLIGILYAIFYLSLFQWSMLYQWWKDLGVLGISEVPAMEAKRQIRKFILLGQIMQTVSVTDVVLLIYY